MCEDTNACGDGLKNRDVLYVQVVDRWLNWQTASARPSDGRHILFGHDDFHGNDSVDLSAILKPTYEVVPASQSKISNLFFLVNLMFTGVEL